MFRKILFGLLLLGLTGVPLRAQFNSGSTGADGDFAPTADTRLNCPEPDCVFNFVTVNIPQNVTVTFNPSSLNTGVTILAQGDVTIAGNINLNGFNGAPRGSGGAGAPGGFRGGDGVRTGAGMAGLGPGGGRNTSAGAGGGGGF